MSSYYESRKYRKHTGKAVPDATSGVPLREVEDDLTKNRCVITLHDNPPDLSREKNTSDLSFLD